MKDPLFDNTPNRFHKDCLRAAKILWEVLAFLPMDEDEQIKEGFLHFPTGTPREDIWNWFEETFNINLGNNVLGEGRWDR